jgi:hypothetical protein
MGPKRPDTNRSGPELSPDIAVDLLRGQKAKGMELVQKKQFDKASLDAWRNQTTHLLQQAFGEQSYGLRGSFGELADPCDYV